MAKKSITQLVPDFREALEEAVEQATTKIVWDLKYAGPYWTGFFESLWQVNPGKAAISANIANPLEVPRQPKAPEYTDFEVPRSPNLGGYTIGNRADYRLYAMDLLPSQSGRGAYPAANLTAQKNWFDLYVKAQMPNTIEQSLTSVFRRYK